MNLDDPKVGSQSGSRALDLIDFTKDLNGNFSFMLEYPGDLHG